MLERCMKEQLVQVAEHYEIELSSQIKKSNATLYEAIKTFLTDQDVLAAKPEDPITTLVPLTPCLTGKSGQEKGTMSTP